MAEFYLIALSAVASLTAGTIGFGSALILIAVGALFLDIKTLIPLATILMIATSIFRVALHWKNVAWKTVAQIVIPGIPFAYWGAILMNKSSAEIITLVLGITALTYVAFRLFHLEKIFHLRKSLISLGGAGYGFLSGFVGAGGVVQVVLCDTLNLKKERFIAMMAITTLSINVVKMIAYQEVFSVSEYSPLFWIGFVGVAYGGSYLGKRFLAKMCPKSFQMIVLGLLTIIGLRFLFF